MANTQTSTSSLPPRKDISTEDTWNLDALYSSGKEWEKDFESLKGGLETAERYRGTLGSGSAHVREAIDEYLKINRLIEKVYTYAHLQSDVDLSNSKYLGDVDRVRSIASQLAAAWSFFSPELLGLPEETIDTYLKAKELEQYRRLIKEIVRYRPHTLSDKEEQLLAQGAEVHGSCAQIFSQLNNADLEFEPVTVDGKTQSLSHGTYSVFLHHKERDVRKDAFEKYYAQFNSHRHTLSASLAGSIKKDVYLSRVKNYNSALERALFSDEVPVSVYENLISAVHNFFPTIHLYYKLRKDILKLEESRLFDTYVPLLSDKKVEHSFGEAVDVVLESLAPLGEEYTNTLAKGFREERWVDKFENKGKRSGAYSSGCYDSYPYMLMNYQKDSLRDVFTLTHEAGHSMHSYYANSAQPYQYHSYTIFVAEVASTFNEQLLFRTLLEKHKDNHEMRAYLINQQIDDIKATLVRQTMFAEFEMKTHAAYESGTPLTLDYFRETYRELLVGYFGEALTITELDELECFRIPHFYSAFYVYKYATGLAAAIALSKKVLEGGKEEREDYFNFLRGGSSKPPLELLKIAGVDLTTEEPVAAALSHFKSLLGELEEELT